MPVASRTCLGKRTQKKRKIAQRLKSGQIVRIIFSYVERENETKIYNLCKLELTFFCLSNVFSVSLLSLNKFKFKSFVIKPGLSHTFNAYNY